MTPKKLCDLARNFGKIPLGFEIGILQEIPDPSSHSPDKTYLLVNRKVFVKLGQQLIRNQTIKW